MNEDLTVGDKVTDRQMEALGIEHICRFTGYYVCGQENIRYMLDKIDDVYEVKLRYLDVKG